MLSELMIAYLFLGGTGAGAMVWLWVLGVAGGRRMPGRAYVAATCALAAAVACLVCDIGRPDRILLLFTQPSLSYVGVGAWLLAALLPAMALICLLRCGLIPVLASQQPQGRGSHKASGRLRRVAGLWPAALELAAALLAVAVVLYSGLLLQSIGTGLPLGSLLLVPLLAMSALSCGGALLILASVLGGDAADFRLLRIDAALIVLEVAALVGFELMAHEPASLALPWLSLVEGEAVAAFWLLVVGAGLALPLAMEAVALRLSRLGRIARAGDFALPVAACVLMGGFALRWSLLADGLATFL
jgi:hypothetical protein